MTVDSTRDTVRLRVKGRRGYWGGNNPGNNLYSNCLIALTLDRK